MAGRHSLRANTAEQHGRGDTVVEADETDYRLSSSAGDGLGGKTARGALVTLAGQATQLVLQLLSVVILARLLSPHDFGLYALGLVMVGVGEVFRDFGLSSASIQAPSVSRAQRDNLFWANTALGSGLMALSIVIAPLFGALFNQPDLVPLARVLSVTFLINGLASQFRADLNRKLKFAKLALTDLAGQTIGLTVAVVCALMGARYWSLVASQLAQLMIILMLVLVFAGWLPGRPQRGADVRPFLRFGATFAAGQIVSYASNNLDSITIGIRFGATSVGIYNRAFQLLMNPLNQFRIPATTVALPVFSRIQHDIDRTNAYIKRGQVTIGYTVVLGLALLAGAAHPVVHLVLGSQWNQVTPIFALLAAAGIFQMLAFVGYWVYIARGLTSELFRYTLASFVLKAICISVGSLGGIVGVAAGYAIAPALAWPLSLWWLGRKTQIPTRDLYLGAARILALAGAVFLAVRVTCNCLSEQVEILAILAGLASAVLVCVIAMLAIRRVRTDFVSVVDVARRVASR